MLYAYQVGRLVVGWFVGWLVGWLGIASDRVGRPSHGVGDTAASLTKAGTPTSGLEANISSTGKGANNKKH
jgi:hypothetical protein